MKIIYASSGRVCASKTSLSRSVDLVGLFSRRMNIVLDYLRDREYLIQRCELMNVR